MILKFSPDLPDGGPYVPLTRQFGRGLLEYLTVVREDIGDVETVVTEMVANVIRHAQIADGRYQTQAASDDAGQMNARGGGEARITGA